MAGHAAVLLALTAPGQTAGTSVFIDPMLTELGLSRSVVSASYLIGTLAGAVAMPAAGRLVDRYGVRRSLIVISAVFGVMLVGMSVVTGVVGLTAGFIGIRMLGQGALGLAATTITTHWFDRKRGVATGLVSAVGLAGISLAPIGLERVIAATDWRTAWVVEAVIVWAVALPIAYFGVRNRPADIGQHVDGVEPKADAPLDFGGLTRAEALRTPAFWVLGGAIAITAFTATGIAFHQIDMLAARGLSPAEAAGNFLPQTVAGVVVALATGAVLERFSPRLLIATVMVFLTAGLLWGTVVTAGTSALGFGLVIGAAGYMISPVGDGLPARLFGTRQIGAIRGVLGTVSVGASAFGPVVFTLLHGVGGSYALPLLLSVLPALAVGGAACVMALPPSTKAPAPKPTAPRRSLRPAWRLSSRPWVRRMAHARSRVRPAAIGRPAASPSRTRAAAPTGKYPTTRTSDFRKETS